MLCGVPAIGHRPRGAAPGVVLSKAEGAVTARGEAQRVERGVLRRACHRRIYDQRAGITVVLDAEIDLADELDRGDVAGWCG